MAEELISNDDATTPKSLGRPLVTPSTTVASRYRNTDEVDDDDVDDDGNEKPTNARRTLFPPRALSSHVTPLRSKRQYVVEQSSSEHPPAKRRLMFGRLVNAIECQPNVKHIYNIIRKLTGSIGGNGHVGPIYGELTMNSMQKMIDLMVKHCGLDADSRFIDVGSGIGKPNFHVAQYPGVSFSCGVEVEHTRFALGMTCLKAILDRAMEQDVVDDSIPDDSRIRGNTLFLNHDITHAKTFDPFTHVYMFSIGFPPSLWLKLSDMWNKSLAPHLVCYHGPKDIIHSYAFDVELIAQTPTSMHGSKEGHMGYIYKRKTFSRRVDLKACDPLFSASWEAVKRGLPSLHNDVTNQFQAMMGRGRKTRSRN